MSASTIVYVQGYKMNDRTRQIFVCANALLALPENGGETEQIRIMQGSYNTSVDASGGTHNKGAALDISAYNYKNRVKVFRKLGCAAWYRAPLAGVWGAHIHLIVDGDDTASDAAKRQVVDYHNRLNGLANRGPDNGYRMERFPKFVYNGSKKRRIARLGSVLGYYQPYADSDYKISSHSRGFVWPEPNLCKVSTDGGNTTWYVSRSGVFWKASQHLTRPLGYVSAVGAYECTTGPAYARETASLTADHYDENALPVGGVFTGLGYVDRPTGRFIVDYRGAWWAAQSFRKV